VITRIAIFDLDETLCNTQHRIKHILKGNHDKYNSLLMGDTVYNDAKQLFHNIKADENTAMYISTARPFNFWISTQKWLQENCIPIEGHQVFMRDHLDNRSDKVIKLENLQSIRHLHKKGIPVIAFDDRSKIIKMYRSQGVTALQIRKGEY